MGVSTDNQRRPRGMSQPFLPGHAEQEKGEERERADIADLERHLEARDAGKTSWRDGRELPMVPGATVRSISWCEAERRLASPEVAEARSMREPGGFRRSHLVKRADDSGVPHHERPPAWNVSLKRHALSIMSDYRSFIENSYNFAADDCFSEIGDRTLSATSINGEVSAALKLNTPATFMALFKANIGLIVIMCPGGWKSGGWLVSTIACPLVSMTATFCGLLLIQVRSQRSGSYGELMFQALGRPGRVAINTSVILVLLGTVCGYLNTIAQLLQKSILPDMNQTTLSIITAAVVFPITLLRKMAHLRHVNLLGSSLVLIGLFIIIGYEVFTLWKHGARWDEVQPANSGGFFVFLGLACSAQEGLACLVPIYDAVASPQRFHIHYMCVMTFITTLLCSVGLLGYLAFGEEVETIVLINFTPGTVVSVIQVAYAIGAFCTMPIFVLPSVTLMEVNMFTPMSNPPLVRKMAKNLFRLFIVALLAFIAIFAAAALKNFTSMLGALCGVPLSFVFPAVVHLYLAEGISLWQRMLDRALIFIGLVLTVIITIVNAQAWGTS